MKRIVLAVLALTVTACASSTAPTVTVMETPVQTTTADPSSPSPTPSPTLPAHPTATQVAAALACGSAVARLPAKNGGSVPDAVSEAGCTLDGTKYVIDVYASEHDLTSALLAVNMLLGPTLRKPWTFGAGDVWIVGVDTGKNGALVSLPEAMVTAVETAGGVVKTIKP